MAPRLEIIAQSLEDAVEAEQGGADRVELVRSLEFGGLTPTDALIESVLHAVKIPVRVMLRPQPSMDLKSFSERQCLLAKAGQFASLPLNGVVAGFLDRNCIDEELMLQLAARLAGLPITFHRAFDEVGNRAQALNRLKPITAVDRILTAGAGPTFSDRLASVLQWQKQAGSSLTFMLAPGLNSLEGNFASGLREVHVGRAARVPPTCRGRVDRQKVSAVKKQMDIISYQGRVS